MLNSYHQYRQPTVPPFMASYIHQRVGRRAAYIAGEIGLQLEINKSKRLIGIEERYRNDLIRKEQQKKQQEYNSWH